MGMLILNLIIFAVLTWYFDHIIEHNRGNKDDYLFFLKSSYWKPNNIYL